MHSGPGRGKTVALTFDDGPGLSTPAILKILRKNNVPATFFMVGIQVERLPKIAQMVVDEGQLIGNHTYKHANLAGMSAAEQKKAMSGYTAVASRENLPNACVMRPPYGATNRHTVPVATELGMTAWHWTTMTDDSSQPILNYVPSWTESILRRATDTAGLEHPVILMHDGRGEISYDKQYYQRHTERALQRIIDHYRDAGYTFIDLMGRTELPDPS